MREILFRGKRTDNGEWVYGYFWTMTYQPNFIRNTEYGHSTDHEVIPETVGQYTGLNDKNGVKIFEGDLLKVDGGDEICITKIKWDNELGGWTDNRDFDGDSFRCHEGDMSWCQYTKIIGNIHDNPELIK